MESSNHSRHHSHNRRSGSSSPSPQPPSSRKHHPQLDTITDTSNSVDSTPVVSRATSAVSDGNGVIEIADTDVGYNDSDTEMGYESAGSRASERSNRSSRSGHSAGESSGGSGFIKKTKHGVPLPSVNLEGLAKPLRQMQKKSPERTGSSRKILQTGTMEKTTLWVLIQPHYTSLLLKLGHASGTDGNLRMTFQIHVK